MSLSNQKEDHKKWHGGKGDVYAVFREQLVSWCLGHGRNYSKVLLGQGSIGAMKYMPAGADTSDDEDPPVKEETPMEQKKGQEVTASKVEDKMQAKEDLLAKLKRRQNSYNMISEKIYSRILSSLGTTPTRKLLTKGVTTGDARAAFRALEEIYGRADPLDLPTLFYDLINKKMQGNDKKAFTDYTFDMQQCITAIDSNPQMSSWKTLLVGHDHVLPDALLNSLYLNGLSSEFGQFVMQCRMNGMLGTFSETVAKATSFNTTTVNPAVTDSPVSVVNAFQAARFSQPNLPSSGKKKCFNWMKTGKCKFGSRCRYLHDQGDREPGVPTYKEHKHSYYCDYVDPDLLRTNTNDRYKNGNVNGAEDLAVNHNMSTHTHNPPGEVNTEKKINVCYAVFKGKDGVTGIYRDWASALPMVKHRDGAIRTGVRWKKCHSINAAESFLYSLASQQSPESNALESLGAQGEEIGTHLDSGALGSRLLILDTGTNVHVMRNSDGLTCVQACTEKVRVANGQISTFRESGNFGCLKGVRVLQNGSNLVSIGKLCEDLGKSVLFTHNKAYLVDPELLERISKVEIGSRDHRTNGLYAAKGAVFNPSQKSSSGVALSLISPKGTKPSSEMVKEAKLIHDRLAHIGFDKIAKGVKSGVICSKVPAWVFSHLHRVNYPCCGCGLGKMVHTYYRRNQRKNEIRVASRPLQRLHIDTCVVSDPSRWGAASCFILLIDEYTRYVWVRALTHRAQAAAAVTRIISTLRQRGHRDKIDIIRSDGAREFTFGLADVRAQEGATMEIGAPYQSCRSNPFAERGIRTICQMARCSIQHAKAPVSIWPQAIQFASYIYNRVPHNSLPQGKTPFLMLHGSKAIHSGLRHVRSFFCPVYTKHPNLQRGLKFHAVSQVGRFVGVDDNNKGYLILVDGKIQARRDVCFHEHLNNPKLLTQSNDDFHCPLGEPIMKADSSSAPSASDPHVGPTVETNSSPTHPISGLPSTSTDNPVLVHPAVSSDGPHGKESHGSIDEGGSEEELRRSSRTRAPPTPFLMARGGPVDQKSILRDIKSTFVAMQLGADFGGNSYLPKNYNDAMTCKNSAEWNDAIQSEYKNMADHGVFNVVPTPDDANIARPILIFCNKYDEQGRLKKRKARLCLDGRSQKHGIDFDETFSPVVRGSTLRTFLSLSASLRLDIHQYDISAAFLHAKIPKHLKLYMRAPPGFRVPFGHCLRLNRALYGGRQSNRLFNQLLASFLISIGFIQSVLDPCLFILRNDEGTVIVCTHVDDLLMAYNNEEMKEDVYGKMSKRFKMGQHSPARYYLGLDIICDSKSIQLSCRRKILDLAEKFRVTNSNPIHTPLATRLSKRKADEDKLDTSRYPYSSLVGALLFISNQARPDVSYTVGQLCRYMHDPSYRHWAAAIRCLKYLLTTADKAIEYRKGEPGVSLPLKLTVRGFSDSDYAGDESRKSQTGYLCYINDHLVNWRSTLQSVVSLSTLEAELYALVDSSKDTTYLHNLLIECGRMLPIDVDVKRMHWCDNQPTIAVCKDPAYHGRAKHIDIRYHYARELYRNGQIDLQPIASTNNPSDILTKPLSRPSFQNLTQMILVDATTRGAVNSCHAPN